MIASIASSALLAAIASPWRASMLCSCHAKCGSVDKATPAVERIRIGYYVVERRGCSMFGKDNNLTRAWCRASLAVLALGAAAIHAAPDKTTAGPSIVQ